MTHYGRRRSGRGFTLIEVMVVIAIVAVVSSFAVPGMRSLIQNSRIKQITTDLHFNLALARSEAIKRNTTVTLDATNNDWTLGWQISSGGTVLRGEDGVDGISLEPGAPTSITYNRNGRLTAAVDEIRLYIAGNERIDMRCISIALSGHPRTTRDSDGNRTDGCD